MSSFIIYKELETKTVIEIKKRQLWNKNTKLGLFFPNVLCINSIYDYTNIHHDNSSHRQHLKVYLQHQSAAFPQLDSHTSGHVTRQQIIKTYRKRVKLESELWHSKCSTPDIHPDKTFFFQFEAWSKPTDAQKLSSTKKYQHCHSVFEHVNCRTMNWPVLLHK